MIELSRNLSNPLEFIIEPLIARWENEYDNGASPEEVFKSIVTILKGMGMSVPSNIYELLKATDSEDVDKLKCVSFYITCYKDIIVKILVLGNGAGHAIYVRVSRKRESYESVTLP